MTSVTVSIPEDIRKKMKQFPEINWSGLVKKIIQEKIERLMLIEEMRKKLEEEKEFNEWAVDIVRNGRRTKK